MKEIVISIAIGLLVDISSASGWSNVSSTLIGPPAQSTWDGQSNSCRRQQ